MAGISAALATRHQAVPGILRLYRAACSATSSGDRSLMLDMAPNYKYGKICA
jgi:hypothetical protein